MPDTPGGHNFCVFTPAFSFLPSVSFEAIRVGVRCKFNLTPVSAFVTFVLRCREIGAATDD
jgi:hypothetical protein